MIDRIDQRVTLNNRQDMPGYGFGLYKTAGRELLNAVQAAYIDGYRLYDTAAFYRNEETVGEALKKLPKQDVFLVSKIWPTQFGNPAGALDASLRKLRRDCLDGYLLHWPGLNEKAMLNAWEILLREQEKGKILNPGVSNFLACHLESVHRHFGAWPPINQIEIHPWFQQKDLCNFCQERNIAVMAWSPLGRGAEFEEAVISRLAMETGTSPARVILRWHVQSGRIPIPKSAHPDRIRANADVFNFSLATEQMTEIAALDRGAAGRKGADPMTFAG